MSDPSDAISEALALNRKLAASLTLRRDELRQRLERVKRQRAQVPEAAAGAEAEALRRELDAEIASADLELARVDGELKAALAELEQLRELGREAPAMAARAVVAAATAPADPIIRSHEEAALDRAREHIGELDAQASLGDPGEDPLAGEAAATRPASTPLSQADRDAQARAEFEALRARRGQPAPAAPAADGAGAAEAPPPGPPRPPKKTL